MTYAVSIQRCASYDEAAVDAAIARALEPLGGMAAFVHAGQRVLVKPNLLAAFPPERAVTTHPAVVKAVLRRVRECGATPVLGDSPGGTNTRAFYEFLLRETGMRRVLDETGTEAEYLDGEVTEIPTRGRGVFRRLRVARAPVTADAVIALPKLKTHQLTRYTGAVKLLYGYLPGVTKVEYHLHAGQDVRTFTHLLLDLYETLPPTLTIMDAVVGMEGHGPSSGNPRDVGLILASASGTALDFVMTDLVGLDPLSVPTVREAAERGLGPGAWGEVVLHGEPRDGVRVADFVQAKATNAFVVPRWFSGVSRWLFASRPVIDPGRCTHCGTCVANCPPKAMRLEQGQAPEIDYGPCIRCFCCHELCPAAAIRVADPRLRFPAGLTTAGMRLRRWADRLRHGR